MSPLLGNDQTQLLGHGAGQQQQQQQHAQQQQQQQQLQQTKQRNERIEVSTFQILLGITI